MPRISLIRAIYLYLLSLVGIILVLIGGSGFVSMGLKTFIFTQADDEQRMFREMPPRPYGVSPAERIEGESRALFRDSATKKQWEEDYEAWRERRKSIDPVAARRHREAASNLSFILVGLPLYLYHWRLIRRDHAGEENEYGFVTSEKDT
jgi:hypothetical protein